MAPPIPISSCSRYDKLMPANPPDRDHVNRPIRTLTLCALYQKVLRFTCPRCKHQRLLEAVTLWWMFERRQWNDALPLAIQHFYCKKCWASAKMVVRPRYEITNDTPDGPQFPYPREGEWKRLVRRFRT